MHIVVVGVDHTTAPIELRERLACSARQTSQLLAATLAITQECVLLSTCNRVELYTVCADEDEDVEPLLRVLADARQIPLEELKPCSYSFANEDAITHLFEVTSGLLSLVPGEPQIQGQVAEAVEIAQGGGYAGPILSALFRAALVTGKRARRETAISRNAASVSHVAVQLAKHLFSNVREASILLVGSGEMSELAARNLRDNGAQRLVIVNRTYEHAVHLAQSLGALHRSFTELFDALLEADVVITSTKAPRALITTALMQRVMERRADRSLLLIDIALPRDVEPGVGMLPGVHLYNLDDLQAEVKRGIQLRLQEVQLVQAIIAEEVSAFERWLASLSVVGTISDLRQHADDVRRQELERAMHLLAPTLSEREAAVVRELTTRLMNKLLHTPTRRLKDAAASGQGHVYAEALRYLFDLEEEHAAYNDRNAGQQARYDTNAVGSRAITSPVAQS